MIDSRPIPMEVSGCLKVSAVDCKKIDTTYGSLFAASGRDCSIFTCIYC